MKLECLRAILHRRPGVASTARLLPLLLLALPAAIQAQDYTYTSDGSEIMITKYSGSGGAVTIPDTIDGLPVTGIGEKAFYRKTGLTNVMIGSSVTSILAEAFGACRGLTSIDVSPANTTYSSMAGVLFNEDQTVLIQFPGGYAGSYTIPGSVTNIADAAFRSSMYLTNITIPDSVITIGVYSFTDCDKLSSVVIPDSITSIGKNAFFACSILTNVTIGASDAGTSDTTIGISAFNECSALTSVTIGNNVTSIGDYAFSSCGKLSSIVIPDSVISIGSSVFRSCGSLTNVTIGSSVTSIGADTFAICYNLTSVRIPDSVTSIGDSVFRSCGSLTEITVDAGNSSYSSLEGVLFNNDLSTLVAFPGGKAGSYTVFSNVTTIGYSAFSGCTGLTNITIPDSLSSIGNYAFYGCAGLTGVYFEGDAPSLKGVLGAVNATVYYLAGTLGWGETYGGQPTALWILTEPTTLVAPGITANQFVFTITGASDLMVVVEACTNLNNPVWSAVSTNILTGGSSSFSDPVLPTLPDRFYRTRMQ